MNTIINKEDNTIEQSEINCENCHSIVKGRFCSECGQSTESSLKYFWTVILHLLDDIFSFDSRASRTIVPLLFNPGFLTKEYIAGRRVHYVPPLRLYLFISIIFFLSLKFFIDTDFNALTEKNKNQKITEITQRIDQQIEALQTEKISAPPKTIETITNNINQLIKYKNDIASEKKDLKVHSIIDLADLELKRIKNKAPLTKVQQQKYDRIKQALNSGKEINDIVTISNNDKGTLELSFLTEENNKILNAKAEELETKAAELLKTSPNKLFREAISKLPQIMFVILPLFALLLKVMFILKKRLYMEHLTVALHSHSFIFLSILLIEIFNLALESLNDPESFLERILIILSALLVCWIPVYLYLMQKRIYQQGYLITSIKYFVIGILYIILLATAAIVAFVWGLLSS